MSTDRISVTRRIAASASAIFEVVSDPNGHVRIDGSGMLMAAPDAAALRAAGDVFLMDMDREPLGDVPLGKYQVINTVTRIAADELIEWNVGMSGYPLVGHVYGYSLVAVGQEETDVTNYCDWSGISDKMRSRVTFPVVPASMLEQSLVNLERIVIGG